MNKRKNFIKGPTEFFICGNCGKKVKGGGYINHCQECLFSKHVDKNLPGDRLSSCGGLMEPQEVQFKSGKYIITHRCLKCGKIIRNKSVENDNFDKLIFLSQI